MCEFSEVDRCIEHQGKFGSELVLYLIRMVRWCGGVFHLKHSPRYLIRIVALTYLPSGLQASLYKGMMVGGRESVFLSL